MAAAVLAGVVGSASPAAAASCNVNPSGVSFGAYDPLSSSPLDGVGNIAISCDASTSFAISLSTGAGSYAERRMSSGGAALTYNLYTDASRLTPWGDGSGGSSTVSMTGAAADIPVYGRMAAHQNVPAGAYADTIVVTITY
ncbi:MAG TPA: spore coat U domain-containing protein [Allosphingosinicella sp.]